MCYRQRVILGVAGRSGLCQNGQPGIAPGSHSLLLGHVQSYRAESSLGTLHKNSSDTPCAYEQYRGDFPFAEA
jgi:hypothetical protein